MIRGRTKLVCTIGPASADRVGELVAAGMDVARLNFSHGTDASRVAAAGAVREAGNGRVALMVDLPGPKIRLGALVDDEVHLEAGATFVFRAADGPPGDATGAQVSYLRLADDVQRGDRILLADGAVELRVIEVSGEVLAEVVRGGIIRSRAGVSVPSDRLSEPGLTEADRAAVPQVLALGADYVAQSFVRSATDIDALRALLGADGPPIIAKVETRAALDDFDAICSAADAVMIARGDLGVELPYEEVPILQKQLVRRALDRGVPTIVATQMLESMVAAPRPTRAEASDVANAIFDGADAIMLSGETAIGAHPVLATETAARIAALCDDRGSDYLPSGSPPSADTDADALAYAAVALTAADRDVAAIACYTRSGRTARILSALRPRVPIRAFSPEASVVRRLALVHGVEAGTCLPPAATEDRLDLMAWLLGEDPSLPRGSAVVLVASTAAAGTGPNVLEVARVGSRNS
ncbi:MAG: pyruvate kinase [Chloroflexota bacterium]|nr:pyruvate kinase [Chloroflexota bacterium]